MPGSTPPATTLQYENNINAGVQRFEVLGHGKRIGTHLEGQCLLSPVEECASSSKPHASCKQRSIADSEGH